MDIVLESDHVEATARGKLLAVTVRGKLERSDYERFVPAVEQLIEQQGKLCILVELVDFHGWTAGALWEDIKFDVRHFNDIARVAVVGDKAWEKGMTLFCKPFTTAKVRYFERARRDAAREWLTECLDDQTGREESSQ